MIITKIEQQKKNKNRVSVYIDNEYAFGINVSIYEKYRLFTGQIIDENYIKDVIMSEEKNKAINYSLNLLSIKRRTKNEIHKKLIAKEYEDKIIAETIDYLELNKYIDDEDYAQAFTKEKIELNKYGKRKIRAKLYDKGIDSQLIDESLLDIDEDMLFDNAKCLAKKKMLTFKNIDDNQKNQKIYRFLISRGYEYGIIKKILSELSYMDKDE